MDLLTPTTSKALAKSLTGAELTKCVQDVITLQDKDARPQQHARPARWTWGVEKASV
ncbi:MAG: hypothetical protein K2X55_07565 [Burkholderiaceae bacterium]|nr:hypothetical protein [Burkholderiaceae bacterium]